MADVPSYDFPTIPLKLNFTIGEASDLVGVPSHVLRDWEKKTGCLLPEYRAGRRYYRHADILVARRIRILREGGLALSGVARELEREQRAGWLDPEINRHIREELRQVIGELKGSERAES